MRAYLRIPVACLACFSVVSLSSAFVASNTNNWNQQGRQTSSLSARREGSDSINTDANIKLNNDEDNSSLDRRDVLASLLSAGCVLLYSSEAAYAADDDVADDAESFASIAARAKKMSKEYDASRPRTTNSMIQPTDKSVYDFTLPIAGVAVPFKDIVRQQFKETETTDKDGVKTTSREVKVKAIIVVNIKQDDPVARKTIPELISLAAKYGRGSEGVLAVVACPTDQGYYEPDTSQLLKMKMSAEYGYGINPSTVVTDKVNMLGTGAVPFWRWLQSTCRTPAGLGRIEGNFEKFLIDGRTGLPVRRYPRKYRPLNMADDIEAIIEGRQLPPAQANYLEEWRTVAAEADRDTYRFEKGLNVFDQ